MTGGLKPSFSLNDLIHLEDRRKHLNHRRDMLAAYKSLRLTIEYENGIAARLYIDPYIKTSKANRLIKIIDLEINSIDKILKHFK